MLGKTSLSLTRGDNDFNEEPFRFFLFYHRTMNFCFFTLTSMGQYLKSCMSSLVPGNLLVPVVEENGGKNDLSMWGHVTQGRVSHVGEVLLSLTSVKGVIVSINPHWWD